MEWNKTPTALIEKEDRLFLFRHTYLWSSLFAVPHINFDQTQWIKVYSLCQFFAILQVLIIQLVYATRLDFIFLGHLNNPPFNNYDFIRADRKTAEYFGGFSLYAWKTMREELLMETTEE